MLNTNLSHALLGVSLVAVVGCGDDAAGETNSESSGSNPAVLVAVIVEKPEDRNIYVGAVPEVPEGELDYSHFLEFGSVDVSTFGGYVFVWEREPARMTRFTVNEALDLVAPKTASFERYGAAGGGENVFVSSTRAYLLTPDLDSIVVWDPETMGITGSIPVDLERAFEDVGGQPLEGFETFTHKAMLVGDRVVWQLVSSNWDTNQIRHATTLLVADASDEAENARIVEDERCAGANGGYVDGKGDYYVRADAYWGYFSIYGDAVEPPQSCVLRLRAGETEFDPDYQVDMRNLTGSNTNFPWFHVEGSHYLAQAWDESQDPPSDSADYWYADMVPLLVDIDRGTSEPYPDLDGSIMVSSQEWEVDGVAYYEKNPEGYVIGGTSDIVELRPEGVVSRFTVPGLWAFGRVR